MTTPALTVVACLTPPGQAALAVLGIHGPRAWDAVRAVFRPRSGELPAEPVAGRLWLGRMGGEVADDVVVAVRRAAPIHWLEINGHGGPSKASGTAPRPCPDAVRGSPHDPS